MHPHLQRIWEILSECVLLTWPCQGPQRLRPKGVSAKGFTGSEGWKNLPWGWIKMLTIYRENVHHSFSHHAFTGWRLLLYRDCCYGDWLSLPPCSAVHHKPHLLAHLYAVMSPSSSIVYEKHMELWFLHQGDQSTQSVFLCPFDCPFFIFHSPS